MQRQTQEEQVGAILAALMHCVLQTSTKLYLVLDFINGGHLFFQLYRQVRVFWPLWLHAATAPQQARQGWAASKAASSQAAKQPAASSRAASSKQQAARSKEQGASSKQQAGQQAASRPGSYSDVAGAVSQLDRTGALSSTALSTSSRLRDLPATSRPDLNSSPLQILAVTLLQGRPCWNTA